MIRRVSQTLALALLIGDLFAIGAAWVCAYYLRFSGEIIAVEKNVPEEQLMWESLPVVLILGAFAYRLAGQYKIDRLRRFREEVVAAFNGGLLLALFTMAAIFARQDDYRSRAAMALFAVLAILFTVIVRRQVWQVVKTVRSRGYNSSRAIVVGSGRIARKDGRLVAANALARAFGPSASSMTSRALCPTAPTASAPSTSCPRWSSCIRSNTSSSPCPCSATTTCAACSIPCRNTSSRSASSSICPTSPA